jgi:cell division transport system permease protein
VANPDVDGEPVLVSKQEAYDTAKAQLGPDAAAAFQGPHPAVTVSDFPSSYIVTLKNPQEADGVQSEVEGLPGVEKIENAANLVGPIFKTLDILKYGSLAIAALLVLAAILLVANTIRLAALARRKEIEIMRLVGASRIFIALPFLLEALVTAAIGVALAAGALAAFMEWGVVNGLDGYTDAIPFISWAAYWKAMIVVAVAGPVLTLIPTLLLTRKYLRV